ncbi:MAG TPA: serine/threonine-protein kinase [Polyangiaceae bacterium]|nr:serine/threonine-protein kinase [Polyangiaceae bacterium]
MLSQIENSEFANTSALAVDTDPAFLRYRLLASIGRGGMSEIFLAGWEPDSSVQRLVVMKRLNPELCTDPVTVQMFLDEAKIGMRLSHPNIVQTLDVGRFEGRLCLLMEYLKGQPLQRVMQRVQEQGRVLPLELAVKIVIDALEGLGAAHAACDYDGTPLGVVHRDVSPHNLFVEYDGRVKVVDFGIAKATIQEGATRAGLVKGKFAYMAPEQARSEPVDPRADIWSVGVVFWELLTGARLFKGPSEAAMLQATLEAPIPYPAAYRSDVPPVLEQIMQRALERDREQRYGSALEMKEALEQWLDSQGRGFTTALAVFMDQLFGAERDEQQSFIRDLLAQRSPTSSGTMARVLPPPSLSARTNAGDFAELLQQRTQTNQLMLVLERKNRLASWLLVGLLSVLVGIATGIGVVVFRPSPPKEKSLELAALVPHAPPESGPRAPDATAEHAATAAAPTPPAPAFSATEERESGHNGRPTQPLARAAQRGPRATVTPAADVTAELGERAAPRASASSAGPVEPGFLTLDSSPWSVVSVGGRVLGTTPLVRVALPPGDVVLSLSNPETGARASYALRIEPGKAVSRRVGLE